jgi:DNA-binding NtrC family response regulator
VTESVSVERRPARVLVLEDDAALSEVLCEELQARGHDAQAATSLAAGRAALLACEFDVALLDLMLPDGSGIDLLRVMVEDDMATEAIVLTGYAAVSTALEAMKLGAYDYLTKPVRMDELEVLVDKAGEKARLRRENARLRTHLEKLDAPAGIVTSDPAMRRMLATLERVAGSDLPVLIQGETGTGKELVARGVHQRSERSRAPFVAVNCAAVPEQLLESELFGYERGAFTGAVQRKPGLFEVADRGVLFLDEIGDISAVVQAKLLRAVETREFFRVGGTRSVRADVRVVSATNKDLKREVKEGNFREDLFYRLNGVLLQLPPLRERTEDVGLLAAYFLSRTPGPRREFSPRAMEKLKRYPWPGNVRELEMVVRRAAVLSDGLVVDADDLPLDVREEDWKDMLPSGATLAEVEQEYIRMTLERNDGHRGRTAKALGIDVKTLYNKLGPQKVRTP